MVYYQEARVKLTNAQINQNLQQKIKQKQYQDSIRKTLKMKYCHVNYF